MRLINPGLGELVDRMTELELKLAYGGGAHLEEEVRAVRVLVQPLLLQASLKADAGYVCLLVTRLGAVNAAIMDGEVGLLKSWDRVAEGQPDYVAGWRLAHQVRTLREKRHALIGALNELAGTPWEE